MYCTHRNLIRGHSHYNCTFRFRGLCILRVLFCIITCFTKNSNKTPSYPGRYSSTLTCPALSISTVVSFYEGTMLAKRCTREYLHFHCESLNEPLHLRCGLYLHEQIDLSHTHISAILAGQRPVHPITLLVY